MSATSLKNISTIEAPVPWKHGELPVIGVIGAIGGGKSRVAQLLAERGALSVDADSVGHRILQEPAVLERVISRFGPGIAFGAGGSDADHEGIATQTIDRKALGAIVFADPAALRALEAIVHPPIRNEFDRIIRQAERSEEARAIVLDAAVLLEAGWHDLCDRIIFVDAPHVSRLDRVSRQRGWSAATLSAREQAQWPPDQKVRYADFVILNDADLEHLEREVDRIWPDLCRPGEIRGFESKDDFFHRHADFPTAGDTISDFKIGIPGNGEDGGVLES